MITTASQRTLIILNPHAAGGRAGKMWTELEPQLWKILGDIIVTITHHPDEVAEHLDKAYAVGVRRVISIGGDGTNHALVNALVRFNLQFAGDDPMVYGMLPVGTGRDFARGLGMPFGDIPAAAQWIANATPLAVDVGEMVSDEKQEYFLNIASMGMGGEVGVRVNRSKRRYPWTFYLTTLRTMLTYKPRTVRVSLDDQLWYEGTSYVVAVANGTTFGHGMKIAPDAQLADGEFDVVLVKGVSRLTLIRAFQQVYTGAHLTHPAVKVAKAERVKIEPVEPMMLELDGESDRTGQVEFKIRPLALKILQLPVTSS